MVEVNPPPDFIPTEPQTKYYYVKTSTLSTWAAPAKNIAQKKTQQTSLRTATMGLSSLSLNPFLNGTAPVGSVRSCAISSLIEQANLVFPSWDLCGYLLNSGPSFQLTHGNGNLDAAISAPANDTRCTPEKMSTEPCRTIFIRTLARNEPASLRRCIGRVKGLSQTCETYGRCGPRAARAMQPPPAWWTVNPLNPSNDAPQVGICGGAGAVDFFEEPEVERMCGVCAMFSAVMPGGFRSPAAGFVNDVPPAPEVDAAPRLAAARAAIFATAAALIAAAMLLLPA